MAKRHAIPDAAGIFLTRDVGQHLGANADSPLTFIQLDPSVGTARSLAPSIDGYVFTFAFGQLGMQLLVAHGTAADVGNSQVLVRRRGDWHEAEVEIWPGSLREASWPPKLVLTDGARVAYEERWNDAAPPWTGPADDPTRRA
jgi:hypothetical protein